MTPRVQQAGRQGLQGGEQRKDPAGDDAPWDARVVDDDCLSGTTPSSGLSRLQIDFSISYVAPERRGGLGGGRAPREILKGVTGRLRPGRLTAILGPSGAGKTSLLSILAGQRTAGVEGRVLVDGRELPACEYRQHCVLIAQELSLLGSLTARETLQIAADLKLPASKHSAAERAAVVESIAATLGLEACLDTAVTNMSGGERKRLSVGVELVTNPPIMLFDEPTSGLDSVSSVQVVSHLRSLALSGRTVVVVLHQPSSRLFQLFDDVLVMGTLSRGSKGDAGPAPGRCLYCGPADQAAAAFAEAGLACPTFYNIADYVVEVASGEHVCDAGALQALLAPADPEPGTGDALELEPLLRNGDQDKERQHDKKGVVVDVERRAPRWAAEPAAAASYPVSFWVQFKVLLRRSLLVSWRDMNMAWLRFSAHLLVAVILGFLYQNIGNEASKVSGNVACLFFFVLFLFFSNAMPTVLTFPLEASVFYREYSNNWYSLPAYYLAKVLADLPFMVVNPTAFMLVAYYMTDQPTDEGRRCMVWLVCLLTVLLAHAYGLVFGAAFGMQLGIFLVPASTIPLILFSGFFLYIPDIPTVLRWLSYVSSFRYGFEGLVASIYGMDRRPLKCSVAYCHWRRPTKFLEDIGMPDPDYWRDITGLMSWIVVLHVLLLISFKVKVYLRRQ